MTGPARQVLSAIHDIAGRFSPRERMLILSALAVLIVALGYAAIWQPLDQARRTNLAAIVDIETALMQVRAAPGPLAAPSVSRTKPLAAVIADTAPGFALPVQRVDPEPGGVRVTLDEADFAALLLWIAALEADHAIIVTAAQIERRPVPGLVSADLTLER